MKLKFIVIPLSILSLGVLALTAHAQSAEWCPAAGDSAQGCAEVRLSPANLSGDFYLGETLLASAQHTGRLIVPPGPRIVTIRNIQSTELYFGTLFVYPDNPASINTAPGQVLHTVVYPRRQYIRGLLTVTCDVRAATPEDDVGCIVSIDGTPQNARIAAGAYERYVVDAGSHTVSVALAGASADFWSPGSAHRAIYLSVGQRAYFSPRFERKGLLTLTLSQPTARADFYVDNVLAASQAETAEVWVDADRGHIVEVRGVTDAASGGVYGWQDARQIAFVSAGQTRTVRFWLHKEYLKGFFELTCVITGLPAGQNASCRPVIDGTAFRQLAGGHTESFALAPGTHTVSVTAAPEGIFTRSEPYLWEITVREGGIVRRSATWRAAAAPDQEDLPAYTSLGRIVFTSVQGGNRDISLMDEDGSGRVNLTNHPARDESPSWSPDGRRIVFVSDREPDTSGDLYLMDADGTRVTRLTSLPGSERDPVWSPDGSLIAFVTEMNGNQDIAIIRPDGTGLTVLTTDPAADFTPEWSPDNRKLVFASRRDGDEDLYLLNLDTGVTTNLTNHRGRANTLNRDPAWSPDGRWLLFETNRAGGLPDLWVIDMEAASEARPWAAYPRYKFDAAWSPDGARVMFSFGEGSALWIARADGSRPAVVSFDGAEFDWTP